MKWRGYDITAVIQVITFSGIVIGGLLRLGKLILKRISDRNAEIHQHLKDQDDKIDVVLRAMNAIQREIKDAREDTSSR